MRAWLGSDKRPIAVVARLRGGRVSQWKEHGVVGWLHGVVDWMCVAGYGAQGWYWCVSEVGWGSLVHFYHVFALTHDTTERSLWADAAKRLVVRLTM